MRLASFGLLLRLPALILALAGACTTSVRGVSAQQGTVTQPRARSDVITRSEIEGGHWPSAYELIEALRPRWLRSHGPDSIFGQTADVQVHVDGNRLGGINTLRGIPATGITSIRFVDPVTAAATWGGDHANGAIIISTKD